MLLPLLPLLFLVTGALSAAATTAVRTGAKRWRAADAPLTSWCNTPIATGWKVVHWHHVGPKDNGGAHTPITDVRAIWKLLHEKNLINDDGKRLSRNYVKNCLRCYSEYGDPHHKEPRKSGAPATIPQRKWIKANQGAAPRASRSLLG